MNKTHKECQKPMLNENLLEYEISPQSLIKTNGATPHFTVKAKANKAQSYILCRTEHVSLLGG